MAESLSTMRADVIEKFINIETIMNFIISQHYLGRPTESFLFDFLYDEYFTFALRRNVLFAICPDLKTQRCEENKHSFEFNLNRANKIRNYFAQCGQSVIDGPDPNGLRRIPDPKNFDKTINFADLYKEFCELENPLATRLFAVFQEKCGTAIPKPALNLIKE
jgi:hypothetical protein